MICPHCNTAMHEDWRATDIISLDRDDWKVIHQNCPECHKWIMELLHVGEFSYRIYPMMLSGVRPNEDLDKDIQNDFIEAASIVERSPRGAAALLRLCLQKLCVQLGAKGENINDDIQFLAKKGLRNDLRQALDIVRVVGNEAVHPGQMSITDDIDTALKLFKLINKIAHTMITDAREIKEMYEQLPPTTLKAIERRDGK